MLKHTVYGIGNTVMSSIDMSADVITIGLALALLLMFTK
jgi:hypothetical protein